MYDSSWKCLFAFSKNISIWDLNSDNTNVQVVLSKNMAIRIPFTLRLFSFLGKHVYYRDNGITIFKDV